MMHDDQSYLATGVAPRSASLGSFDVEAVLHDRVVSNKLNFGIATWRGDLGIDPLLSLDGSGG